ncbi:hypothetical protein [Streptomyces sp. NPDC048603]|uniref:hypothetical protein n=1 Tax=Streptomyces sp. NPDC048603 TaxID=3365577 RepID=UPI003720E817
MRIVPTGRSGPTSNRRYAGAMAALAAAGAALVAAAPQPVPDVFPTAGGCLVYRPTDDADLAGHSDALVWGEVTGAYASFTLPYAGDAVQVAYRVRTGHVFRGTVPGTMTVYAAYEETDTASRLRPGRRYVIAMSGEEDGDRWVTSGHVPVETESLDAADTRQGEHNTSFGQPSPATQGERWTRAVASVARHPAALFDGHASTAGQVTPFGRLPDPALRAVQAAGPDRRVQP